jgi:hypothetical protein
MVEHVEKGQNMPLVVTHLGGAESRQFLCHDLGAFWRIPELLPTSRRQLMADAVAPRTPGTKSDFPSLVEESLTQDKFHAAKSVLSKTNQDK